MLKKLIVLGIVAGSLFAGTAGTSANGTKPLGYDFFQCFTNSVTKDDKAVIKRYAASFNMIVDKDTASLLKMNLDGVEKLAHKTGQIFSSIVNEKCKKQFEEIFAKSNSLKEALQTVQKVVYASLNAIQTQHNLAEKAIKAIDHSLIKGIYADKKYKKTLKELYRKYIAGKKQ